MKKTAGILLVIVMVVFSAGSGICAETGDVGGSVDSSGSIEPIDSANKKTFNMGDLNLSLGVRTWYSSVEAEVSNAILTTSIGETIPIPVANRSIDGSDSALLFGPSIQVGYGRFFGGITYLTSLSDYTLNNPDSGNVSVKRNDWDLMVGYRVHDRIGLLLGYKRINLESDYYESTTVSPVIGAALNYPLNLSALQNPLLLLFNINYLFSASCDGNNIANMHWDGDGDGYSMELAVAYPISNWTFSAGYKFQKISLDMDSSGYTDPNFPGITFYNHNHEDDSYSGLALTATYRF